MNKKRTRFLHITFVSAFLLTAVLFSTLSWAAPGDMEWTFVKGNKISSPVIGPGGTVYAGSDDNHLYAVSSDGKEKWNFSANESVSSSSPAIGSDGTIYVGSDDFYLYAVDPDGKQKWRYQTNGEIRSSPAIGSDGVIYVGSEDGYLYAFNTSDGSRKWRFPTTGSIHSSPAVNSDGTVYVGSDDNYLYAVNSNGEEKWKAKTDGAVSSSPAIGSDGTVYVGSDDGHLYAINISDGTEKWKFPNEGNLEKVSSSPAIGSDGIIYVGSDDGHLYAINNSDGSERWRFPKEGDIGKISSSPAIGSYGTIYVGSSDGNLYAIHADGSEKWNLNIGESVSSPVIGPGKIIYTGSDTGELWAINSDSNGLNNSAWPMFHHDIRHTGRNNPNQSPTSDAGPDQTVEEDETVTLDGSGSADPDYGISSYQWTQTDGPDVTLSDSSAINPTFTAPGVSADDDGDSEDNLTFQLSVTDSNGLKSSDTCSVKVEEDDSWCYIGASAHTLSGESGSEWWYVFLFVCTLCALYFSLKSKFQN